MTHVVHAQLSSTWFSGLVCISQSHNLEVVGSNPTRGTLGVGISPYHSPYSQGALLANPGRIDLCKIPVRLGHLLLTLKEKYKKSVVHAQVIVQGKFELL